MRFEYLAEQDEINHCNAVQMWNESTRTLLVTTPPKCVYVKRPIT